MIYVFYNNDPLAQDQGGGAEHFRALHRNLLLSGLPFHLVASRLQHEREAPHITYVASGGGFLSFWLGTWRWFWRHRHEIADGDVFHFHRNYAAWPKYVLVPDRGRVIISYHNVSGRYLEAALGRLARPLRALMLWWERRAVARADAIVCVSGRDRAILEQVVARAPFVRATVIPASFDAELFRRVAPRPPAPELARRVLFLGRMSRQKNVPLAIAVIEHLREMGERFALTLVGDGEETRAVMRRIAHSPAREQIRWLGRVPHDRVPELFATHGLLLVTSQFEASPTVVKEALAAMRPVVTTDVGDVSEWIEEGVTGFICPAEVSALARGVCAASRLVAEGRCRPSTRLEAASEREVIRRVLALYRELQAGRDGAVA